ncbi:MULTISPECIES: N-acetylmuramoyl-L-alanine amidase-like domain-containing protein [unclassified Microcoleus]|uniref:N-acetylmuramoyl-L-alanine amidase-like domain-containing protein n=1 Tax=unclassified Microcoleus TaxID=2642155 RepID=UPI0025D0602C|nr:MULTISPECIES: N-acetylmuramoyl-L-alanine amidase-like domain-containing protein [unclassified Microcoleus]
MRNFWSLAVLGFAIAWVNNYLIPDVWALQSQPAVAVVDRQTEARGPDVVAESIADSENREPKNKQSVSSLLSLFRDLNNLPEIPYSQWLEVLARRPDSENTATETAILPEDIARFEKIVQYAKQENLPDRPIGQIIQAIGDNFQGLPYVEGLLDKSGEEKLIVTLNKFDCVLFVETVLAISRGVAVKDYEYQNFVNRIEEQRYLNGKMNGYCSRLHYFSEWIKDNQKRQTVENITAQLGGVPMNKTLNFMSQHRSSYPQMVKDEATYQCIVSQEAELAKTTVNYIPTNRIKSVYSQLKPGDIVAVATDVKGLDVTHTGFVYRNADGNLGLIHASPAGAVTVAYDLQRYISRVESAIGIVVARAKTPNPIRS